MSIRIGIAKWLAPELDERAEFWQQANENNIAWRHRVQAELREVKDRLGRRTFALHHIARLRTPKCAHGVKKACDIADAALSHPSIPTQEAE